MDLFVLFYVALYEYKQELNIMQQAIIMKQFTKIEKIKKNIF